MMKGMEDIGRLDAVYKQTIANHLIQRAQQDPFLLKAMDKGGKSLDGTLAYVKSEARKLQQGGCAVVPDDEVYGWAVHYILEDSLDFEPKAKADGANSEGEVDKSSEETVRHIAERTKAIQSKAVKKAKPMVDEIQSDLFAI